MTPHYVDEGLLAETAHRTQPGNVYPKCRKPATVWNGLCLDCLNVRDRVFPHRRWWHRW